MDYIKSVEQAIEFFAKLIRANRKGKIALLSNIPNNEVINGLLAVAKDEEMPKVELKFAEMPNERNEGRVRLSNYLIFVNFADVLKRHKDTESEQEKEVLENIIMYIFRSLDGEEQAIYKAILSKSISLPGQKQFQKI